MIESQSQPSPWLSVTCNLEVFSLRSLAALTLLALGLVHAQTPAQIEVFEKNYAGLEERVGKMDDAGWTKNGVFKSGGRVVREMPTDEFLWMLFFDAIHHRGQLAAYIRPMGGKVPAIYGPSADSKGGS